MHASASERAPVLALATVPVHASPLDSRRKTSAPQSLPVDPLIAQIIIQGI
jgi:hypothetical protein